ncbi:MAG: LysR family transcriptional regulator [Lachnospiraceae bacterium]|nr:LysR family transcriptional regulator [Lachnospiraceae bacterium]
MTLIQLSYIITIAETGSMNRAAEKLLVSQPSLTNAVKELEKELGVTLLYRSGRGVVLTNDGMEFLPYARDIYSKYQALLGKYGKYGMYKKKFGVSSQHYSFAVKAFVDMAKEYDMSQYEFAIRETMTREVIRDVSTMRSEIGILYLSDFNRKAMTRLMKSANLEFHHLVDCRAYVYLWKHHPLAMEESIGMEQLADYPCLSFEQGSDSTFYLAEEVLVANEYAQSIKANDRGTMLNLMVGLNGYTLCSGIICEELNGDDFVAVPFREKEEAADTMEIGFVMLKNMVLSPVGEKYVAAIKKYLRDI